jgi:hypothetical protein
MATKKVMAGQDANVIQSGVPDATQAAADTLKNGVLVGYASDGTIKLADFRASAGPIVARGFLTLDAARKDPRGSIIGIQNRVSFAPNDGVQADYGVTPGATYWLSSGGDITATKPAATTGDLDQQVGFGNVDGMLVLKLGPEASHA